MKRSDIHVSQANEAVALPLVTESERQSSLDPARLNTRAADAARALLREGESKNTRNSYASAMRYWAAWYAARYGAVLHLPVPVPVVIQFIVDHAARKAQRKTEEAPHAASSAAAQATTGSQSTKKAKRKATSTPRVPEDLTTELPPEIDRALVRSGFKSRLGPPAFNTIVHRLAVLSKAHQLAAGADRHDGPTSGEPTQDTANRPNPCAEPLVRELLARTRRAYAQRGAQPRKQRALTKDPLQALLATCDETLRGKRDRALLLFAWATGGRRRSEVAAATIEKLRRVDTRSTAAQASASRSAASNYSPPGPSASYIYTLSHSKTNQAGTQRPEDMKPLVGSAAEAMKVWLEILAAHGIHEGPLFRRVRKGGHLGEPLAPAAVRDIVQARCALAGIEGRFSAHSLRAGFVTEAGKQNLSLPETMALTGHTSVATVVGYFRAESSLASKASRMLDEE